MTDAIRSAAVQAREALINAYGNAERGHASAIYRGAAAEVTAAWQREVFNTHAALVAALAAAPAPQPTAAQKIDPNITPENQWFGDMMILQVLADSRVVNDQEREVLLRWIAASPCPQQDGPSDAEMLDWMEANCGVWTGDGMWQNADWANRKFVEAPTLREAIRAAMRETGGKTE